ncbi:MAG: SIR2 family protein [Bacteroidetes bacterium]|nr:SIR2 family protein [Bacteroidota bacterium]
MLLSEFVRLYPLRAKQFAWFFGAGTSVSAGMPTASDLVWEFKRRIYCSLERYDISLFNNLSDPAIRNQIQSYFDAKQSYPKSNSTDEYSVYFEEAYPSATDRSTYLMQQLQGMQNSFGHKVIGVLMKNDLIRLIFTTNFDKAFENAAVGQFKTMDNFFVATLDNISTAVQKYHSDLRPYITKIHGDYFSEKLKNTSTELQEQDKKLVNELGRTHSPLERVNYLPSFTGFENTFKTKIELLAEGSSVQIDGNKIQSTSNKPYITLSQELGNAIRSMSQRKQDFDVLFIYLPEIWKAGFEDADTGFDLHDFLKATTAINSIPTQILREGSVIKYRCRCSVMWRLGIALYVKAGGVPWKLAAMDEETAFLGLSYSTRFNQQTNQFDFTTCCSQVFDSDGTGLEFIAYDAGELDFRIGENPFLTRSEMRKLLSKSLSLYQKRHSGRSPKRLIVHKTTHFTRNEIDGAFDAIPGNIKLELLQIVENTNWRGIKYVNSNGKPVADNFPIDRGSYLQTGSQEVMLWTQGNVVLNGKNFFKV